MAEMAMTRSMAWTARTCCAATAATTLWRRRRRYDAGWRRRRRYDVGRHQSSDTYYVDNAANEVTEVAGLGANDRVRTSTSYSLAPGSQVEILETTDPTAMTAISLAGNEYANTIIGNAGTNVIVGGAGFDTMVGGADADVFVWGSITEMGSTLGANSDTIDSDFNAAIGDLIVLNLIDADGNAGNGDTAFTFIGDASNNCSALQVRSVGSTSPAATPTSCSTPTAMSPPMA
jgi:Ca2+-binding RTX toxin-like protein